eukprot:TRINITY_DN4542_c0_g1_i3.p1 TRINITY_DN4542_c0_g1~~TRINITY_DN4542_c0_g1_i3.p1  ORF type:complete len:527 (+),score=178.71 TRINITY_DN4542_c0_g1_i3:99-1679(+)
MVVLKSHLLLVPTVSFAFTSPAATRQPPTAFAPLGPSRAAHGRSARTLAAASRRAASVHRCTMVAAPASAAREGDLMGCLRAGIKAVAVGVKGSKPIPDELVPQILAALETLDGASGAELEPARQRLASFLGTLFVKHDIAESDAVVLTAVAQRRPQLAGEGRSRGGCSSAQLLSVACGDGAASAELLRLCRALLDGEVLSAGEAEALGRRLYDSNEPAAARTLAAHVLRVRYETREEFAGLLRAQASTVDRQAFDLANLALVYAQRRIVQLAEPFDGVDRSPLLTPLIARHLQRRWRALAVTQVGPTSGPKYGPNARDLALALGADEAPFMRSNAEVAWRVARSGDLPEYGMYIDQEAVSPALAEWVTLRRNIIKRPFLATSEKLVDSCGASVLIASAFHPSFTDKMFNMAEDATAFPACIIVRRGLEGTLGFGLGKPAEVTCGVRGSDGRFERMDFAFGPKDIGLATEMDKPLSDISAEDFAAKCERWAASGSSSDTRFDNHVAVTLAGIDKAMEWVLPTLPPL